MRIKVQILLLSLVLATFAGTAWASPCPSTNVVADPVDFQWTFHPVTTNNPEPYYSGVLEYGEATFDFNGDSLTTRAYRQEGGTYSIPGPTLKMEPGNKYVLQYRNLLPYQVKSTQMNVFKDPNVSNLHTHGLHISGETPSDDITRYFEGGYGGDFVYDIPADHMGGTFWYHAHHHGSTFLQVSSGAYGMIVIDDANDGVPANVEAMTERHLIAAYLDPSVAGTGGDTLISGTLSQTWTLNDTVASTGNVCMPKDEWQHWRLLLADRDAKVKTVSVGSNCEVQLMARDGVWRTTVPKLLATNAIDLTGASRADLAVRCSNDSTLSVGSTVVGNIYAQGQGDSAPNPFAADGVSTWSPTRPSYLRDLRTETPSNTQTIRMGARTVNGSSYDKTTPNFTLSANGVEEWTLNGAQNHPFHLHVYHVQMQQTCGDLEAGEYYDVIAQNCDVRFDLDPATSSVYEGRTIMHCHILEHEDQGAMGWADVVGGQGPPTYPQDGDLAEPFSAYYELNTTGPQPTSVEPDSITVSTVNVGGGNKAGRAEVVVVDDLGDPVADAVVSGDFSGDIVETISASDPTDSNGLTVIDSTSSAKGNLSVTFCVTAISHPNLTDWSGSMCGSN